MKSTITLAFAIMLFSSCYAQQEISQWRGPERNGIYPEKNLLTNWPEGGPKLLWKYDNLGSGYASAAVTSTKVYTVGTTDSTSHLFIFDLQGKLLNKILLGKETKDDQWPGIRSTPLIYKDLGYIVTGVGVLYCFNSENGNILWTKDLVKEFYARQKGTGYVDNLLADDERLYCITSGEDKNIVALNRKTGELIWSNKGNSEINRCSAAIMINHTDKKYIIYQTQESIISIDAVNGSLAWSYKKIGQAGVVPFTPLYKDGYIFTLENLNSGSVKLKIAEDGKAIQVVWRNPELIGFMGDAVLLGDRLYGNYMQKNKIACVDWNTGKELYSENANNPTVIAAENLLYTYERNGLFSLVKPLENRFEKVGSFIVAGGRPKEHFSHPVIKDGRLYIRHDNSLFVFNISK